MEPEVVEAPVGLQLPVGIVGRGDVRKLKRELESLEDTLQEMRLRTNAPVAKLPRSSRLLEEFAATNRLNMLLPDDRQRAAAFVAHTLTAAPVLHMSFAAEASRAFTTEIVLWLRANIQADVLLDIGLEPGIAAGCILRTPSKQFDLSLRSKFATQADSLVARLQGSSTA